ncbi:CinA family protein [Methylomonas sp. MO1]|uniref:CinA family protein n=1 Tax=unclassified Methylomonas TaxID=2608980 RepID=UPI00047D6A93|nr:MULTISPECIES: CinA family protein [unclassified Methylomonas]MDT4289003.1 CinA family protein [Methylomonas sp. MO1]
MHDPSYLLAEALGNRLNILSLRLALSESCTGGGIAKAITDVPGSSGWFDRGFVTYSNDAKIDMLGVKPETLARVGAVSEETALEMVAGTLTNSLADLALAVTGIAGPDGGTPLKPVGTVFIAWQKRGANGACLKKQFSGDRQSIRQQATLFCLQQLLHMLENA